MAFGRGDRIPASLRGSDPDFAEPWITKVVAKRQQMFSVVIWLFQGKAEWVTVDLNWSGGQVKKT
jgi:hypothetical protein